jgi:hypothetical protein
MKKQSIFFFFIMLLLWSCNETSSTVYSLSKDSFTKEITDSIVMYVEKAGGPIALKGNIDLTVGECKLFLKYPAGDTIIADTTLVHDTIVSIDRVHLNDSLFSFDSTFIYDKRITTDTVFGADTIVKYDTIYRKSFKAENTFTIDEKFDRIKGKWTFIYKIKKTDTTEPEGSLNFVIKYDD